LMPLLPSTSTTSLITMHLKSPHKMCPACHHVE
jgi:hypothetical protein